MKRSESLAGLSRDHHFGARGGEWAGPARVRAEHRELRAAGARVAAGEVDVAELHVFGAALDAHVRFEERELFPFLEQRLAADELADLGRRLENDFE